MAFTDKIVNLVIRGKNLFSGTATEAEDSLESLRDTTKELKTELDKLQDTQRIIQGFGEQKRAVDDAEQAYQQGTRAVAGLARELRDSEGAGEGLNRQWREAKATVSDSAAAIKQQRQAVTESAKAQREAERELNRLNTAFEKGKIDAGQYAQELDKAEQRVNEAKKAHDANRQALAQSTQANKEAAGEVKRLGSAVNDNQRNTRELAKQFDRSKTAAAGAKVEYARQRQELEQSRRAINSLGGSTTQLNQTQRNLAERQKQLKAEMDKTRQAAAQQAAALRQVGTESDATGSKLGNLARTATATVAAFFGLNTLANQIRQIFTVGDQFERLESQLTGLMGSLEAGQSAVKWIEQFTRDTPLQLEEVTQTFVRLKAFGLDPMDGTMQAVIDQAYQLGGSFQEVEGISLALGQAWAKQKLQGEEILQLIERGVPVWDLLAKVTGKNTEELQQLSSQGQLGRDVIKALLDEMGRANQGAAASGMSQLSGLISNAKDNIVEFYREVASGGVLDWLKEQLAAVNAEFRAMANDGRLKQLAQQVSDTLVAMGQAIKGLITTIYEWRDAILFIAKAWVAIKVASMIRDIGLLAGAIRTKLVASTVEASAKMGTAAAQAGKLRLALMAIPGAFKAGLIIAGLDLLISKSYEAAKATGEWAAKMGEAGEVEQRVAAQTRAYYEQLAAQNIQAMQQFQQFRNVQILTAEQVAALTADELAAYQARLAGLREYLTAQLNVKKAYQELGETANAEAIKIDDALARMRQGFADVDAGIQLAATSVQTRLSPAVQALVAEFGTLTSQGKTARQALDDLFKNADLTAVDGVRELIGTLVELAETSQITADEMNTYLSGQLEKLSSEDLVKFRIAAEAAFGAAGESAKQLASVVDGVTSAAFKKLGLSLQELRTGIDETGQDILQTFSLITQDASASSREIAAAFKAAANRLDTEKELLALRAAFKKAADEGKVAAQEVTRALAWIDEKIAETKTKATEIGDGFDTAEDKARKALERMRGELKKTQGEMDNTRRAAEDMGQAIAGGQGNPRKGPISVQTYSSQLDFNRIRGDLGAIEKEILNVQAELEKELEYRRNSGRLPGSIADVLSDTRLGQIQRANDELQRLQQQARQRQAADQPAQRAPDPTVTRVPEANTGLQPIVLNLPGQPATTVFAQPGEETAFIDLLANLSRTTLTRR
jgi:tape measure domain-containing protein